MAEYKGKLLKGLLRQAKNILMSDGTDVETAIQNAGGLKSQRITTNTTSLGQVRIDTLVAGRTIVALVPNIGTDFYRTFIGFVGTAQGEQLIAQFLGSNGSVIGATSVTFDLFYY